MRPNRSDYEQGKYDFEENGILMGMHNFIQSCVSAIDQRGRETFSNSYNVEESLKSYYRMKHNCQKEFPPAVQDEILRIERKTRDTAKSMSNKLKAFCFYDESVNHLRKICALNGLHCAVLEKSGKIFVVCSVHKGDMLEWQSKWGFIRKTSIGKNERKMQKI